MEAVKKSVTRKRTKSYPGSITKRGDTWMVRLYAGKKYHCFTAKVKTKAEAQNFATEKHKELSGDAKRYEKGWTGPVRFSELVKQYSENRLPTKSAGTIKSYKGSFQFFRAFFVEKHGDQFVREIDRAQITDYIEWRRMFRTGEEAGTVSGHTVARDFRVLRILFKYAFEKGHIVATPMYGMSAPKGERREPPILTPDQLEKLLTSCAHSRMLSLYVLTLAETGMRADSEALQLTWDDVDLAAGNIHIRSVPGRRTKSGKGRTVPMTARLHSAMREHAMRFRGADYDGERSPFVFHHEITSRTSKAGQRVKSFRGSLERAGTAAKLPEIFRRHDLRHRRVTTWLAEGHSPAIVQEAMGHADIGTTMGYKHLQAQHLRTLVEPLARVASG